MPLLLLTFFVAKDRLTLQGLAIVKVVKQG